MAHLQGDYAQARSLFEQSLALFRELGDKPSIALSLNALGGIAYIQGDYRTAVSLYGQGLALYRETQHKRGIAVSLMGLGAIRIGISAAGGRDGPDGAEETRRGTLLLGASEGLRKASVLCWRHLTECYMHKG